MTTLPALPPTGDPHLDHDAATVRAAFLATARALADAIPADSPAAGRATAALEDAYGVALVGILQTAPTASPFVPEKLTALRRRLFEGEESVDPAPVVRAKPAGDGGVEYDANTDTLSLPYASTSPTVSVVSPLLEAARAELAEVEGHLADDRLDDVEFTGVVGRRDALRRAINAHERTLGLPETAWGYGGPSANASK